MDEAIITTEAIVLTKDQMESRIAELEKTCKKGDGQIEDLVVENVVLKQERDEYKAKLATVEEANAYTDAELGSKKARIAELEELLKHWMHRARESQAAAERYDARLRAAREAWSIAKDDMIPGELHPEQ